MLSQLGDQLSAQLQLSELATATTTALQAQMEPHFVFNALNTIASLVRTEPEPGRPLLDEELDRLPAKYRDPLILCLLQGKARSQGVPEDFEKTSALLVEAAEMRKEKLPAEFAEAILTGFWTTGLDMLPVKERLRGRH